MSNANYVLYWDVFTSSLAAHVTLLELDVPFTMVRIDTEAKEHRQPEYLRINPNGLMPAVQLPDGRTLGETAAILLALGERHPEANLVPALDDADRPRFLQWLIALATTGHTTLRRHSSPDLYTTRHDALEGTTEVSAEQLGYFFNVIENVIEGTPYFLERGFGPLDIYLTMLLKFFDERQALFKDHPNLSALYNASTERASFQTAFALILPEQD